VSAAETVARVLARRRQLLLLLDNCEHVIGAAARLCAGLLAACDDVRVLATSREPLAVAGEARYRLTPLTLPGPGDEAGAAGCESVPLFADRARRADARFALDGQTGPVVARLDGMPLAIVPITLGRGVSLWEGSSGAEDRFTVESVTSPSGLTHQLWNKNDHV
jgi:predicted ATPase